MNLKKISQRLSRGWNSKRHPVLMFCLALIALPLLPILLVWHIYQTNRRLRRVEASLNAVSANAPLAQKLDLLHDQYWLSSNNHWKMVPGDDTIHKDCFDKFSGDIEKQFMNLIEGMDEESRAIGTRAVRRLRQFAQTGGDVCHVTQSEIAKYNEIVDYHYDRMIPLNDGWTLYDGRWFIPTQNINSTALYYDHFLDEIADADRVRQRDILDIGAFGGESVCVFRERTDKTIWSFEPSPSNFILLQQTIERNALSGVEPVPLALGEEAGEGIFNEQGESSRFADGKTSMESDDSIVVKIVRLDDFVEENNVVPGVLKLDVEGFELSVLRGAEGIIRQYRPVLLISIYHHYEQFFGAKEWVESLDLGYTFKLRKPHDIGMSVDLNLICDPGFDIRS